MPISDHIGDREHEKFVEVGGVPVVRVANADGSAISAGGGGGTSMTDNAAFTPGGSSVTPIGAFADETSPDSVNEGDVGAVRMTLTRALHVNLRDASGTEVSVGGGTQYDEDTAHTAAEKLTMAGVVRQDSRASLVGADGDRTELQVNANGELRVKQDDAQPVTDNGGSLTVDGTVTVQDGGGSLTVDGPLTDTELRASAVPVSAASLPLPTGAATSAKQDTVIGHLDGVETLLGTIDTDTGALAGTVAGSELQVDVVAALPAGSNNIGDVDVLTVPADPFGANADAAATAGSTGSIQAKLRLMTSQLDAIKTAVETLDNTVAGSELQVDVVGALPAGNNNIGDVDVASLPALPAGTNNIGDVDVLSIAAGSNLVGDVGLQPRTTGGLSVFRSLDLDESEEEVKGSAGQLYAIHAMNLTNALLYLKLYNDTAANVTVGTTTPVLTLPIPGNNDTDGAGFVWSIPQGIAFSAAITAACTTGLADNDTGAPAANACVVNLLYK